MEQFVKGTTPAPSGEANRRPRSRNDALDRYGDNRNGEVTCKEVHRHGIAPVHRSHPAYPYKRDGDGVVCE